MQKRWLRIGMVLGLLWLTACGSDETAREPAPTAPAQTAPAATPSPGVTPRVIDVTTAFVVPRFHPDPIVLKAGEPVQFKVTSADTRHTFIIESLGIDVEIPQKSLNESVTTKVVTPQEVGTLRVFCRIHERLPMVGTIEVTTTGLGTQ
jgi:plastocyanin